MWATAIATAAEPPKPEKTLQAIVVSVTRSARPAFEVPAAVTSVSLDEDVSAIPAINPSDALAGVPGLLARNRQNYSQDEQISVRGFGARSSFGVRGVRLYVDGIPATLPDGQGQVSNFLLDAGGRIEVLRGPFSALYGNSSGGVIQIYSADGADAPGNRARLGLASFGGVRASFNMRGADQDLDYNLTASHFLTRGYRGHGQARRSNAGANLGLRLDPESELRLVFNAVDLPEAEDPLGLTLAQFQADPRQASPVALQFNTRKSVTQATLGAIYERQLESGQSWRWMVYGGRRTVEQFLAVPVAAQTAASSAGGVIDLESAFGGSDLQWRWLGQLGRAPLELTAGLSYDRQQQDRRGFENFFGTTLGVTGRLRRDEDNDASSLDQYLQASWDFHERWSLSAGARHSTVDFDARDHFIAPGNPDDSGHIEYSAFTPVAGLLWRASARWHLYAGYGRGFETPTFNELGYRPDRSGGLNLDLRPARSHHRELGSKWQLAGGSELALAGFEARTRDELAVASSSGGRTAFQNIRSARRRGAEASGRWPLSERWSLKFALTWLDARFTAPFLTCAGNCVSPNTAVASGARIPGVPKTDAWAALQYHDPRGWRFGFETRALSAVSVNDLNSQIASGHAVLALSGGYSFNRGSTRIALDLRLDNLLDRRYAGSVIVNDGNGRHFEPAPGRNGVLGVSFNW